MSTAAVERSYGSRYRSTLTLKEGQGVETLLGTDATTGETVVIKTADARSMSSGAAMRLEHEAEVLQHLRGPHFAPVLSFGRDAGSLYLVAPYVAGATLAERLGAGPLTVLEALAVGRAVMGALAEVHNLGVGHRDVKPANLIVNGQGPIQHAVLIDFGLARSARLDAAIRDPLVGAARYMSPEQAGVLDEDIDARSDLYSAGVVLYECLAGHPPFDGESVGEVLRMHVSEAPAELRTVNPQVPRALSEVVQRLLRKDPRDRYQRARAVLADLDAIALAIGRGDRDPAIVVGAHDWRRTLTEPAFVGRTSELATLGAAFDRARKGTGGLALLEAQSGGGKTRLLGEFALQALRAGGSVLRGQGVDGAAHRPLQLLVGVATGLVRAAACEPTVAEALREQLADSTDAVVDALPELRRVMGAPAGAPVGPETFGEGRTVRALATLLDALGSSARPALVLLDDGQWADTLTLKVLDEWSRRTPDEGRHVLVVVAFRPEEAPADHLLRTMQSSLALDLPPLPSSDVRQLAASMAGPLPDAVHDVVARLSEGSPFMVSASLLGLVESGALAANPDGWQVEPLALSEVQCSHDAAALLQRRVALLPKDALAILEIGAVLGKDFDLALAANLAGLGSPRAIAAIDEARGRHIVWAKDLGARCAFVHDRLREAVLARVPHERHRALHRAAALWLEAEAPDRVFEIAYHFDAAGDAAHALPFALAAAGLARARHALGVAEDQYRIAERGADASDAGVRRQIVEGLGDVLMLAGRYEEAAAAFESVRELSADPMARAGVEGKLGELWFKRGDVIAASRWIESALQTLGRGGAPRQVTLVFLVLWEAAVQVLHTLLPRRLGRRSLEGAQSDRLAAHLYTRLTYVWFARGTIPMVWAHLRAMNLAERYPPTPELAHAYSLHAPAMALIPLTDRGIDYANRSLAIRKSLGDLWGQGQTLCFRGAVLYSAGRFEECIAACREGIRLLERAGDLWEVNLARCHLAWSHYHLGDLASAIDLGKRVHESGVAIGDRVAADIGLDAWSRASGGNVPDEALFAEIERPNDNVQAWVHTAIAVAVRLLAQRRPQGAVNLLEQALARAQATGLRNAYVFPVLPWLATALRLAAEATPACAPSRKRPLLRRARVCAKRALSNARISPNDRAHALRELGLVAAMEGSARQARRFLDASLAAADRLGQRLAHAETLLARGQVGGAIGWPGASVDVAAARKVLASLGAEFVLGVRTGGPDAPATLSLADRFDTVLDAGRLLASCLSRSAVHEAVRSCGVTLLRAERCEVFEAGDGDTLTPAADENPEAETLRLARRAAHEGRVLTMGGAASIRASESMLASGVRSALCAPIFVRDRVAGAFCITSGKADGLFGEEEERLAGFIAVIAGTAMENAEGFAKLQRADAEIRELNAELAGRVRKRTVELHAAMGELEAFSYSMSHDLREPLRSIDGFSRALLDDTGDLLGADGQRYLQNVRKSAQRMGVVIDDLVQLSNVARAALRRAPVDLSALARSVLTRLDETQPRTGVQTIVEEGIVVAADPHLLEIALTNLLENAWKFTGKHPCARIEFGRQVTPAGEPQIYFVRDDGAGFDPAHAGMLFGTFKRMHSAREFEGSGVGLATVQRIVGKHGGKVWAAAAVEKGATFYFTLEEGSMRTATTPPDANVSAATSPMAAGSPNASAVTPASSAPSA